MLRRLIDGVGNEGFSAAGPVQKPRGDVRSLARDRIVAMVPASDGACDYFACGYADMYGEGCGKAGCETGHAGLDLECGAHGALGVVATGERRAEQRHRRVADMLVDRSSKTFDDRSTSAKKRSSKACTSSGSSTDERRV